MENSKRIRHSSKSKSKSKSKSRNRNGMYLSKYHTHLNPRKIRKKRTRKNNKFKLSFLKTGGRDRSVTNGKWSQDPFSGQRTFRHHNYGPSKIKLRDNAIESKKTENYNQALQEALMKAQRKCDRGPLSRHEKYSEIPLAQETLKGIYTDLRILNDMKRNWIKDCGYVIITDDRENGIVNIIRKSELESLERKNLNGLDTIRESDHKQSSSTKKDKNNIKINFRDRVNNLFNYNIPNPIKYIPNPFKYKIPNPINYIREKLQRPEQELSEQELPEQKIIFSSPQKTVLSPPQIVLSPPQTDLSPSKQKLPSQLTEINKILIKIKDLKNIIKQKKIHPNDVYLKTIDTFIVKNKISELKNLLKDKYDYDYDNDSSKSRQSHLSSRQPPSSRQPSSSHQRTKQPTQSSSSSYKKELQSSSEMNFKKTDDAFAQWFADQQKNMQNLFNFKKDGGKKIKPKKTLQEKKKPKKPLQEKKKPKKPLQEKKKPKKTLQEKKKGNKKILN